MNTRMKPEERRSRVLTDEDAEAVAAAFKRQVLGDLYKNFGMGVWGIIWRALIVGLLAIAAFGAGVDRPHWPQ